MSGRHYLHTIPEMSSLWFSSHSSRLRTKITLLRLATEAADEHPSECSSDI